MMIAPYIEYGRKSMRLDEQSMQSTTRSPDMRRLNYRDEEETAYPLGSAPPEFSALRIVEKELVKDGPGWLHRCQARGLISDRYRWVSSPRNSNPEEGWDMRSGVVYTAYHTDTRWMKGQRPQAEPITGISGEADDDKLSKTGAFAALVTGQMAYVDFASGFTGLISGTCYWLHKLSADEIRLALSNANALAAGVSTLATAIAITGTASTDVISSVAHGLNDGDAGTFPTLTGGYGLTVITVPYYVVNKTADTFQVALTPGGTPVDFTTNISAGTFRRGTYIDITLDGADATLRPVISGMETLWLCDREDEEDEAPDYYALAIGYKGLLATSTAGKPFKRRINTTGQTVTNDAYPGIIYSGIWQGYPPTPAGIDTFAPPTLGGTMAAEFDLPQISVTDVFVSTSPPPTEYVPGFWIPADAPSVTIITTSYGDVDAFTYHYPSGWKVLNLQSEQLAGQQIWLIALTWGYQIPATPRTA